MGLCKDWRKATHEVPYSPFVAICAPPMDYKDWTTGKKIPEKSVDLVVRLLFMQKMHLTYPVTGTVCTVAAAMIPGTIANQLARKGIVGARGAAHRPSGRRHRPRGEGGSGKGRLCAEAGDRRPDGALPDSGLCLYSQVHAEMIVDRLALAAIAADGPSVKT